MNARELATIAIAFAGGLVGCAGLSWLTSPPEGPGNVTEAERLVYLREAEVWRPIDTANLDLRRGPPESREPDVPIHCDFVIPEIPPLGKTKKFLCRDASGERFKVKYDNDEIYGEVLGSRLLWALGFFTDRVDPVNVVCHGCPEDPWGFLKRIAPGQPPPAPPRDVEREFFPSTIESYYGLPLHAYTDQGFAWGELLEVLSTDPQRAEEQRAQRQALALLSSFLEHGDSKPANQTLACAPGGWTGAGAGTTRCAKPVAYVGDVGAILGHGWLIKTSKVKLERWMKAKVWSEPDECRAHVRMFYDGTLKSKTRISEAGRRFLADRLVLLDRSQIRDMFVGARMAGIGGELETPEGAKRLPTIDDWVAAFETKVRAIVDHRCPK